MPKICTWPSEASITRAVGGVVYVARDLFVGNLGNEISRHVLVMAGGLREREDKAGEQE